MMRTYSASDIANEFIAMCYINRTSASHLKIHKLLYISHAYCLAACDHALISGGISATEYGPACIDIFDALVYSGASPIKTPIEDAPSYEASIWRNVQKISKGCHDLSEYQKIKEVPIFLKPDPEGKVTVILKNVMHYYGEYAPVILHALTHGPGTPWSDTTRKSPKNSIIPDAIMKDFFASLMERNDIDD